MSLHVNLMCLAHDLTGEGKKEQAAYVLEAIKRIAILDDLAERVRQAGEIAEKVPRD